MARKQNKKSPRKRIILRPLGLGRIKMDRGEHEVEEEAGDAEKNQVVERALALGAQRKNGER